MNKSIYIVIIVLFMAMGGASASAQNVKIEDYANLKKKKKFKINGGVSANTTLFNSNEMGGRKPFIYQFNGNLNLSLFELLNIPLSFNLNNYGSNFSYPSLPNRLSIHPSYKWALAHIGDVNMTFSPYTLNGHLFTGVGVELTPGKWSIMAMGGRMTRRVDYDYAAPNIMPSYNRYGYGVKTRYNGGDFFVGANLFTAKDHFKEVSFQADSLGVTPKSNVAMSIEAGVNILPNLKVSGEYASSFLTRDVRSPLLDGNFLESVINRRESTNFYYAIKGEVDYTFWKNTIGLGYERISPRYETLGAYYFNNDYQNFTLNYARPLLSDKANIAVSVGLQHDDLDNEKESRNTRFVGSANFTYAPTEEVNLSASTSNFQGHRVVKSQFDYINQTTPYENLDTLSYTQISQNVDFNVSWRFQQSEQKTQNVMLFLSYQEAADKQGKYILPGNLTRFFNASTNYTIDLTSINTSFNAGVNVSNNYSNMKNFLTFGPSLAVNTRLFEKKVVTGVALSYNLSRESAATVADVFNVRWNANWKFLKRHSVQASLLFQQRNRRKQSPPSKIHSLTTQLGYFYNF